MRRRNEPTGWPTGANANGIDSGPLCLLPFSARAHQLSDGKLFARRMAAPDLQHVVSLVGGWNTRRYLGPAFVRGLLYYLRCCRVVGLWVCLSRRRDTGDWRIGSHRRSHGSFSRTLPKNENSVGIFLLDCAAAPL